jgi:hypothetical protein
MYFYEYQIFLQKFMKIFRYSAFLLQRLQEVARGVATFFLTIRSGNAVFNFKGCYPNFSLATFFLTIRTGKGFLG